MADEVPVYLAHRPAAQQDTTAGLEAKPLDGTNPDDLLAAEIEARWWRHHDLRSLEAGHLRVEVHQGIARIYGHVAKALNRARAEAIALAVPGIAGVHNELVVDGELQARVALALAEDERTRSCIIPVRCFHGWVYLGGSVPDGETQAAAETIAAGLPQVRGVLALPQVAGQEARPVRRAFQPEIGSTVYGGKRSGRVVEVVVDPASRLVTHVAIAEGSSMDGRHGESTFLLPADLIELAREGSLWLKAGTDLRDFPVFDPAKYPRAPASWQPPFPYRAGTVRWPAGK